MEKLRSWIRGLYASTYYKLVPFLIAAAAVILGDGGLVPGLRILAILTALALVLTDDLMPALHSFFLLSCLCIAGLSDQSVLIAQWRYAIPGLLALGFHMIVYRKPFLPGKSFPGLLAAAGAALLGGLGTVTAKEYFDGVSLGYLLLLSVIPVGCYYLFATQLRGRERDRLASELLACMLLCGVLCGLMIFWPYAQAVFLRIAGRNPGAWLAEQLQNVRNPASAMIVISLSPAFYFSTRKRYPLALKPIFFLVGCGLYFLCLISMSRSALLAGSIQAAVCIAFTLDREKNPVARLLNIGILVGGITLVFCLFREQIAAILSLRIEGGLIDRSESRVQLILRALQDLKRNPLFGAGIGYQGNYDVYHAPGCMGWYHSLFPQIIGSMGLVGLAAWGYQLYGRAKLMLTHWDKRSIAVAQAYVGLFLFSQTDVGEFAPIPFAILAVLAFAILEDRPLTPRLKRRRPLSDSVTVDKAEKL